jgi:ubiquinone/menaquinone biosynthesis C-methylase UbiE
LSIFKYIENNYLFYKNNIYYFQEVVETEFSKTYISLREKENRLYSDTEILVLPYYKGPNKNLIDEWNIRRQSAYKIKSYIQNFFQSGVILEIGCGNGWFSNFISSSNNSTFGIDINHFELLTASRLFYDKNRVNFIYGNIFEINFPSKFADVIILPSSIQYFENLKGLLSLCNNFLKENGEIHIIDSNFYRKSEVLSAKLRSNNYFEQIGFSVMEKYYYHHSIHELLDFNPRLLYNPNSKFNFIKKHFFKKNFVNPFPWIRIKKV